MKNPQHMSCDKGPCLAVGGTGHKTVCCEQAQQMSIEELKAAKENLVMGIQAISLCLGQLLQERHYLQEEVAGRHVTIAQLLRVQETRASELGLQPAVQMSLSPAARR